MSLRTWRRAIAVLAVTVITLLAFGADVQPVSAAFSGRTTNDSNSLANAATFPTYSASVIADNPLFYYRLDDSPASLTAADSSGHGLTGVYGPAAATNEAWLVPFDEGSGSSAADMSGVASPNNLALTSVGWATGHNGTAGSFDGSTSYGATSTPVVTTTASFTVAAWVYLTSTAATATVASQDGTAMSPFYLQYNSGINRWAMTVYGADSAAATAYTAADTSAPALNTWTQLTGVYDSVAQQVKLYVNGVQTAATSDTAAPWSATGATQLGRAKFSSSYGQYFPGRIDDARVYSLAEAQTQVTELADGITGGPSTQYDFSESSGSSTADLSGNSNTGTLGSGASFVAGKTGNGVQLNGTANSYVTGRIAALNTSTSFTVSAWVYPTTLTISRVAVSQSGSIGSAFMLKYNQYNSKWEFATSRAESYAPAYDSSYSSASASLNTWVHLIGVYDSSAAAGNQVRLYVNGAGQTATGHTSTWNATGPLQVGRVKEFGAFQDGVGQPTWGPFLGIVDDVRTYRRALSAAEIALLYNGGVGGANSLGHNGLGQPGALQGAQQGQQASTSNSYTAGRNSYNPTRYSNPTTFSMECWFQSNTSGGTIMDFGNKGSGNSSNYGRRLQLTAAGAVVFAADSALANTITSSTGYLDGNWHHVVATLSPSTGMALYLDGSLVGTVNYSTVGAFNGVWRWGGDTHNASFPSPDYFTGRIDEVAVYGTVLSAQQVAWHYHANH